MTSRPHWPLLLPAIALLALVVGVPILRVLWMSLHRTDVSMGGQAAFVGLEQFFRLWEDGQWKRAISNTVVFTLSSVTIELCLGLAFALLLHRVFRGRSWMRALVVLPWVLPTAVMALAWAWIANDTFGVANDVLRRLHLIGEPVAWLGRPATAMATIVLADVWKTTPFVTLVLLSGLSSIPESVLEASRLDGLGTWPRLFRVLLPLLLPAILVAVLFRLLQAFAAFDLVYVMTGGGPGGSTETISLYAYRNYFRYLDFGYGSAVAVQAVVLLAFAAWIIVRASREREGAA